ncbi:23667_t:CDS:2 [Racocetra persica]|uniref:23667_t:CDS:1 n=1 Tax=Racocetra persica TaxID=160502 RepID=A0ACA9NVW2_9GLOM|nr:23667_t:CDS:2 [Racocetra persica]
MRPEILADKAGIVGKEKNVSIKEDSERGLVVATQNRKGFGLNNPYLGVVNFHQKYFRFYRSEKIKKFLEQERVDYEVYQEQEKGGVYSEFSQKPQKISEAELGRAYQEAWSNPQRYQEARK